MPLEFSGAAYRFGDSMVRPNSSLNRVVLARKESGDPSRERIPAFSRDPRGTENLNGFPGTLPAFWGIALVLLPRRCRGRAGRRAGGRQAGGAAAAFRIDALLAEPLQDLPEFFRAAVPPGGPGSILGNLAFRNLKRGPLLRLPSGQAVSRALGIEPLPEEIVWGAGSRVPALEGDSELRAALGGDRQGAPPHGNTPLWFHILREAKFYGATGPSRKAACMGGQHLGPVGGRIVAETLIGLLWLDPASFLHNGRGFRRLRTISGERPLTLGRLAGEFRAELRRDRGGSDMRSPNRRACRRAPTARCGPTYGQGRGRRTHCLPPGQRRLPGYPLL